MQTNRINGEATIDILAGQEPKAMVGLNEGGTPNHKMEAAAVAVGFFCLVKPKPAQGEAAVQRTIQLLEKQLAKGHMLFEVFTDSHAPIWLRAMTSLRIYSLKLRGRGGQFERLEELVQQWFEHHFAALSLGWVPSGKLGNTVILPCGRKTPGKNHGQPPPGDMVRDVFMQMAMTGKVQQKVGKHFWDLSKDRQDTVAGPLTKQILATEGFGPNFKRGTLPKLCGELVIERFDGGHEAHFPNGIPDGLDVATSCWIEYDSGKYSFQGDPPPFAEGAGRVTRLIPA